MFTAARKAYADGERRRVPVKFYAKVQTGEPVMAAVMDEEGHRAVLTGPVPEPAQRAPLTAQSLADQFAKTAARPIIPPAPRAASTRNSIFRRPPSTICAAGSSPA